MLDLWWTLDKPARIVFGIVLGIIIISMIVAGIFCHGANN